MEKKYERMETLLLLKFRLITEAFNNTQKIIIKDRKNGTAKMKEFYCSTP